jgi:hypothetical protein
VTAVDRLAAVARAWVRFAPATARCCDAVWPSDPTSAATQLSDAPPKPVTDTFLGPARTFCDEQHDAAQDLTVVGPPPPTATPRRCTAPSGMATTPSRPPDPHWHGAPRHGQPAQPLAIGILHAHGDCNIAAALRRNARDATRVLPLLGITSS